MVSLVTVTKTDWSFVSVGLKWTSYSEVAWIGRKRCQNWKFCSSLYFSRQKKTERSDAGNGYQEQRGAKQRNSSVREGKRKSRAAKRREAECRECRKRCSESRGEPRAFNCEGKQRNAAFERSWQPDGLHQVSGAADWISDARMAIASETAEPTNTRTRSAAVQTRLTWSASHYSQLTDAHQNSVSTSCHHSAAQTYFLHSPRTRSGTAKHLKAEKGSCIRLALLRVTIAFLRLLTDFAHLQSILPVSLIQCRLLSFLRVPFCAHSHIDHQATPLVLVLSIQQSCQIYT